MAKEGMLSGLTEFRIMGLPLGAVAGGAAIGGVGDALAGLVTGFVPAFPSWAVKALSAFAVIQWGPRIVGKELAQLGGLFLTYDAVQELFNIRGSVANIVGGVTGKVIKQSPPAFTGAKAATTIATGYYPSIGRRAG